MELSKEITEKIQELQLHEKNLQNFVIEKQNIQIELNGVDNALNELKTSGDEVYKILDGIMLKANKSQTVSDLNEKKKILEIRINSIEKQEKSLDEKITSIREKINSQIIAKGK